jgi:cytidylate kinase
VKRLRVAIDGPAGAGKSTVSRRVADELGYVLLDTGALYRAVALASERAGVPWDDGAGVGEVARGIASRDALRFELVPGQASRVLLDGEDISTAIRTQAMGQGASRVSALPEVRAALLDMQRRAAVGGGVVLEGRDIGTVVLPDAEAKFFLTASVEVRARRRLLELESRGEHPALENVVREVKERDERDSTRAAAPLRQAEDAVPVDSSSLSIDDVVGTIVAHVRQRAS